MIMIPLKQILLLVAALCHNGVVAFQPVSLKTISHKSALHLAARSEYLDKARRISEEGAEDFTWEELEEIRDNIHRERVLDLAASGTDNVEYHMLEDELDKQLAALEEFTPDGAIFQLHQDQERVNFNGSTLDVPSAAELLSFEETMASENLWEPIGMCLAVALFILIPQLIAT